MDETTPNIYYVNVVNEDNFIGSDPLIYYVNVVNEDNFIGSDPLIMYLNVCEVIMEEDNKANSLFMGCI